MLESQPGTPPLLSRSLCPSVMKTCGAGSLSTPAHLQINPNTYDAHHTHRHRHDSKQRQQAVEGGKRQPRDLLYCGVTSSKKTCVCKMYSLDSLSALTDNNDLPGNKRLTSGLQEHVQLPFSDERVLPIIAKSSTKSGRARSVNGASRHSHVLRGGDGTTY